MDVTDARATSLLTFVSRDIDLPPPPPYPQRGKLYFRWLRPVPARDHPSLSRRDRRSAPREIRDSVSREAALGPIGNDVSHPTGPVRRCVFNYSIIHPAIHHQPSVKFILFLCIGPLQFAAPCINLLLAAICLARAASNTIVPICRGVRGHVSDRNMPLFSEIRLPNKEKRKERERQDHWPREPEHVRLVFAELSDTALSVVNPFRDFDALDPID